MREIVRFAKPEAVPEAREVLAAQGLPEADALAPRLRRLLDDAMHACAALVEPRAVCEELPAERAPGHWSAPYHHTECGTCTQPTIVPVSV